MLTVLPGLVVGLNVPQVFDGVHDQVTPELLESPVTTTVRVVVAPGFSDVGGAGLNETDIAPAAVMVMVAEAEAVELFTDVAVMVTEFPAGIAAGAV